MFDSDICKFCGRTFVEHESAYSFTSGYMINHSKYGYLEFEPIIFGDGYEACTILHEFCAKDGPEEHAPKLLTAPPSSMYLEEPHCSCCLTILYAGDAVFQVCKGGIDDWGEQTDISIVPMRYYSGGVQARAIYFHKECISAEARVHLPSFGTAGRKKNHKNKSAYSRYDTMEEGDFRGPECADDTWGGLMSEYDY